jgi:4-hydroxybenzoate polyprenyltransferase
LIGKNIGIRLSWVVRNRKLLLASSLFILLISSGTLFYINISSLFTLVPLAILSILYVTPFIPFKGKMISLRKIPFTKIFIIALVWTLVTVMLPYVNEHGFSQLNNTNLKLTLLTRFLFVFAITLPFDIRDIKFDNNQSLKTIPSIIGIRPTVIISELLLVSYLGVKCWQYFILHQLTANQLIALVSSIVVTMLIISFSFKKRPELYYSAIVEASMLILHLGILVLEY